MQIKEPGMFSRGKITLPPSPHLTPETLIQELTARWGQQGFQVYPTALLGADVILKKSGWTGVAIKIKQGPQGTEVLYNAFSPSIFVRLLAMGLIPILIVNATSWKPLLKEFRAYVETSPLFGGQMAAGAQPVGQLPPGQMAPGQPGMPMGQPGMPPGQPGMPMAQPGMPPGQPGMPMGQPGMPPGQPGMPPGQPGVPQPQGQVAPAQPQGQVAPGQPGMPPGGPMPPGGGQPPQGGGWQ
ncbi:MAG: hypothetical protein JRI68_25660 [Deltaproteobacteria bacterium]|nr:hypothetical protein [Deltaproteobacteria bacterium]